MHAKYAFLHCSYAAPVRVSVTGVCCGVVAARVVIAGVAVRVVVARDALVRVVTPDVARGDVAVRAPTRADDAAFRAVAVVPLLRVPNTLVRGDVWVVVVARWGATDDFCRPVALPSRTAPRTSAAKQMAQMVKIRIFFISGKKFSKK